MNCYNVKRSIFFIVLLGISMPSHAWFGQETLTWACNGVASAVSQAWNKPSENKGIIATGIAAVATVLVGGGIFAYWWNKPAETAVNDDINPSQNSDTSDSDNNNLSSSSSEDGEQELTDSSDGSLLDSSSSGNNGDQAPKQQPLLNSKEEPDQREEQRKQALLNQSKQLLLEQQQKEEEQKEREEEQRQKQLQQQQQLLLEQKQKEEQEQKEQQRQLMLEQQKQQAAQQSDDEKKKIELATAFNELPQNLKEILKKLDDGVSKLCAAKEHKDGPAAGVAELRKLLEQIEQQQQSNIDCGKTSDSSSDDDDDSLDSFDSQALEEYFKKHGLSGKGNSLSDEAKNKINSRAAQLRNEDAEKRQKQRYTIGAMQASITPRNMNLFMAIQDQNNLPTWNDLKEKFVAADKRYQIHFILSLCGLKNEQKIQDNINEILPKIKDLKQDALTLRAKEFYQQYREQYSSQTQSSSSVADSFVFVSDEKLNALEDALSILDKGGSETKWYAFDSYKQDQIKFMMRRFKPNGIKDSSSLKKGVLLSIHGTFVNAANFGSDPTKKAGVALIEAVQRLADAKNMEIDMIIPEWSGDFNDQHRRDIAPLAQKLMMAWHKKQIDQKRNLVFIDMLGHSEGNSVIKLIIESTQDANVRKLIRWYSVCPTSGSDYVPEGTKMRLCIWSPEDALAFIASVTRGRVYRKQDNDIGRYNGLCVNMCLRYNGQFTNHVTSKLPAFAHYDTLFDVAEKFKGHCELSIDINDKNKRVLTSIRRGKECRNQSLTGERDRYLEVISKKNEDFFVNQYEHITNAQQWHEKPHTMAGFIVKFFKHGYYEKVAGDAEDLIEAQSLTDEQIKKLRALVCEEGQGWQTCLSISSPSIEPKPQACSSSNDQRPTSSQLISPLSLLSCSKAGLTVQAIREKLAVQLKYTDEQQNKAMLGALVYGALIGQFDYDIKSLGKSHEECVSALIWYWTAQAQLEGKSIEDKIFEVVGNAKSVYKFISKTPGIAIYGSLNYGLKLKDQPSAGSVILLSKHDQNSFIVKPGNITSLMAALINKMKFNEQQKQQHVQQLRKQGFKFVMPFLTKHAALLPDGGDEIKKLNKMLNTAPGKASGKKIVVDTNKPISWDIKKLAQGFAEQKSPQLLLLK